MINPVTNNLESSQSLENLAKAQVKLQKEVANISEDTRGYNYNYTSLDKLLDYVRPLLTKHGFSFIQMPVGNDFSVGVKTLYMHESGEWVSNTISSPIAELGGMNTYQSVGSAITYFRRYSLSSFVGIASEKDEDAKGEQVEVRKKPNYDI